MNYIDALLERRPELTVCGEDIRKATDMLENCCKNGGKILLCGNGGSAADCEHISGELLKGFLSLRTPDAETLAKLEAAGFTAEEAEKLQGGIPAVPLTSLSAVLSAFANDVDPALVFAQLTYALGGKADVLMGLSTSGNSKNVVAAAKAAKALGIPVIAMTGETGGKLLDICDVTIRVPEKETFLVQEYHLPVYHAICAELEARMFG